MKIDPTIEPELTAPLTFLKGGFALWNYKIPYYSCIVPLSFAEDKFSLIDDIPDSERFEWKLEELFQRDIAWERIEDELVQYLRNENRPQFFNALTVALLPKAGHGFSPEYTESLKIPKLEDDTLDEPIQVGDIQVSYYSGSNQLAGKIRWCKDTTIAVAVDGQHRLAAIKRIKKNVTPEQLKRSSIPVIFVIPHVSLGYTEPPIKKHDKSIISSLRRIFIDLNKNARQVSTIRNILLDDQDLVSVCTRNLIGEKLSEEPEVDRIPLGLIDWVSEKNKFETGPFLSTVLIIYEIINKALEDPKKKEAEGIDDQTIKNWLERVFSPSEKEMELLMGLRVMKSMSMLRS